MKVPAPTASRPGSRREPPPAGRGARWKRPFDLAVIAAALLFLLPLWLLLLPAIAAAIRLEDGGRVLYVQRRVGRDGREFDLLKFRTMAEDAETETGPVLSFRGDRRPTRIGRRLRALHLDELPQVVNVLRGEMSLVGPRPERPEIAARLERLVPGFERRLRVLPGIMGLAQARGGYRLPPRRKLRYDLLYASRMSPWLDLRLCALCVLRVLRSPAVSGRRRGGRR